MNAEQPLCILRKHRLDTTTTSIRLKNKWHALTLLLRDLQGSKVEDQILKNYKTNFLKSQNILTQLDFSVSLYPVITWSK